MRSLRYILFAVRSLRAHLMRSILAVIGIVIGIAAVSIVVALAEGARAEVSKQIASLGSNLLLVQPGAQVAQASDGLRGAAFRSLPLMRLLSRGRSQRWWPPRHS